MSVRLRIRESAVQLGMPEAPLQAVEFIPQPRLSLDDGTLRRNLPTPATVAPIGREVLRFALAARHLQIAEATLRDIRFYSADRTTAKRQKIPGNGFARAFLKLGRSVYVDIPVFVEIWRSQQTTGASHG